ncbi:MAG: glycosyltransferase family 2 protein [Alphaproteobacteria bacterium]
MKRGYYPVISVSLSHHMQPKISIIIPVFNESGNVLPLAEDIQAALDFHPAILGAYEVIFIDDASLDATCGEIMTLMQDDGRIRLLRHGARMGISAAIRHGINGARAEWIVTCDGDGQNDPSDIPRLLQRAWTHGKDGRIIVCGVRIHRCDTWQKRLASKFANGVRRALLKDGSPDTGCALKAFRRDAYLAVPFFNGLHRFMPAMFKTYGHEVVHILVNDRPRLRGQSKSGIIERGLRGFYDIFGVIWLTRRTPVRTAHEEMRTAVVTTLQKPLKR